MPYIGVSPFNGVRRKHTYTATASQTSFSGAGTEGATLSYTDSTFVDVFQNGVKLGEADYTATSGTAIVLAQGASLNDLVEVVVYDVFSVADTVSKSAGGTFDGNVAMGGTLGVTGIATFTDDIIIGDGKTIGSASKVDAITIASSGLTQLRSTGIGAGSPVLQVIDDGTTILNVRAEDGNISFPVAGAGIYLGVTSGNSANLLNDYETGSWTPTLSSTSATFSYSFNSGHYVKVGDIVSCWARITSNATPSGTTSNALFIAGLPFTIYNQSDLYSGDSLGHFISYNIPSGYTNATLQYQQSTATVILNFTGDTAGESTATASAVSSSTQFRFRLTYRTA